MPVAEARKVEQEGIMLTSKGQEVKWKKHVKDLSRFKGMDISRKLDMGMLRPEEQIQDSKGKDFAASNVSKNIPIRPKSINESLSKDGLQKAGQDIGGR